nr:capsid protein [Miltyush picorna-like virus 1]
MNDNKENEHVVAHEAPNQNLIDDPQQILTIQDVERKELSTLPGMTQMPRIALPSHENRDHTIMDILSRRRLVKSLTIAAGGSLNDSIVDIPCPDILYKFPIVTEKLSRFAQFRASTRITLIFTAAPSTSGGFLAFFTPDVTDLFISNRTENLLQSSQWPHNIINLNQTPETSIVVPWVSPWSFKQIDSPNGKGGWFRLRLLAPLSDKVDVTIYAELVKEDLYLEYPTIAPPNFPAPADGVGNGFDVTYHSGLLDLAKPILKAGVPMIANTLGVGGILSTVKNTLSEFGFSKPMTKEPSKNRRIMPAYAHITEDGEIQSHELAQTNSRDIQHPPGIMGSDIDEMNFDYICRRPNWLYNFTVTTDMPAGAVVASIAVTPFKYILDGSDYYMTHQALIASQFMYWFGSMIYDFHGFLTPFHSLKLRFTYSPGGSQPNTIADPSVLADAMSTVVHFGVNSTHQVKCEPVKNVMACENPFMPATSNTSNVMGKLYVTIETPLLVTGSVAASSVHFAVFQHMEEPIFTVPSNINMPIATKQYTDPVEIETQEEKLDSEFYSEPRSEYDEIDLIHYHSHTLKFGTTTALGDSNTNQEKGIVYDKTNEVKQDRDAFVNTYHPERLTSIRQIARQFTIPINFTITRQGQSSGADINQSLVITPAAYPVNASNAYDDRIDSILSMFACFRGGWHVRLGYVNDAQEHSYKPNILATLHWTNQFTRYFTKFTDGGSTTGLRVIPIYMDLEKTTTVHIPYYTKYVMLTDRINFNTPNRQMSLLIQAADSVSVADSIGISVSRAIDNSFQAGFLCPPLKVRVEPFIDRQYKLILPA